MRSVLSALVPVLVVTAGLDDVRAQAHAHPAAAPFTLSSEGTSASGAREAALLERIEQLEAAVARLELEQGWSLTEARAQQIRELVEDVLADATSRSSLQSSGMTAGWDKGFFLSSPDGNFRLRLRGYLQVRYIYNHRNDPPEGADASQMGFENSRTQLFFEGYVLDPTWQYRIQGEFSPSAGSFVLLDGWIRKQFENGFALVAGQGRVPFMREFLVVETAQLAVDRSIVHAEFSAFRSQGIIGEWQGDAVRLAVMFNDGTQRTGGANTAWNRDNVRWAVAGRGEVKLAGDWSQFDAFSSWRGDAFGALIGFAGLYQSAQNQPDTDQPDIGSWTADLTLDFGGANLFVAGVGRTLDPSMGRSDQFGLVAQGGVFLLDALELFARYEWGDSGDDAPDLSVITVGANVFFNRNGLKWTTDIGYGINPVSPFWASGLYGAGTSSIGWLPDAPDEDGQVVVRTQLQLMF